MVAMSPCRISRCPVTVYSGQFSIQIFGVIGPANAGKTTFLKCINRMLDFVPTAQVTGDIEIHGDKVMAMRNVYRLRRRIGMVFPLPVGLPMSVYENVAYAPRQS